MVCRFGDSVAPGGRGFSRNFETANTSENSGAPLQSLVTIDRSSDPRSDDGIAHFPEEARRQVAVAHRRLLPRDRADVVTRPREPIPFRDNDPGSVTGQPKISTDGVRHLDRELAAGRRLGSHRYDVNLIDPVLGLRDQNDRNRPVLYTFVAALGVLVFPQVAVIQNLTRFRQQ